MSDKNLWATPETLEDPEKLNAIQTAVSLLELPKETRESCSKKRPLMSESGGRHLKKQRLNMS